MDDKQIEITQTTLQHYRRNAEQFFAGTIDHDVSQNIAALLEAIAAPAPYRLLDLGCGPGRDLKAFKAMGHEAIGIDGSARFVRWRAPTAAAKCGSRISSSSICRRLF
jgi:predicted TPR repeat methyltransferase